MKLKMFSLYDSKALVYGSPMLVSTVGSALRSFGDVANDPSSVVCKHATDFVLFQIGEFDDQTGKIDSFDHFINLGLASDFKKVKPQFVDTKLSDKVAQLTEVNGKEA